MTPENIEEEEHRWMVCNYCGAQLPQGAVFCMNCGAKVTDMGGDINSETRVSPPVGDNGGPESPTVPKRKKRIWIIVAVAVAVVLALGGGVGGWWIMRSMHDKAFAACESSVGRYTDAAASIRKTVSDNADTSKLTIDDVGDQKLIDAYAEAEKDIPQDINIPGCRTSMSTNELDRNASQADREAKTLTKKTRTLQKAAKAISDAREAKMLVDASTALDDKTKQAQDLLNSNGSDADSDKRSALQTAIDNANKAKDGKDANGIADASKQLDDAMNAVSESAQANSTPCSAFAGGWGPAGNAGGGSTLNGDCTLIDLFPDGSIESHPMTKGTFQTLSNGSKTWMDDEGNRYVCYPPNVYSPEFETLDDRGTWVTNKFIDKPRIVINGMPRLVPTGS